MTYLVEPGAMVGVLGGGQLGAMFAGAARRLGYRVAVWDPDPWAPALKGADLSLSQSFADPVSLEAFATAVSAATYEWENVPAEVADALERRVPVRPAAQVLRLLQDRFEQKTFLASHGFPVVPFRGATSLDQLSQAEEVGFPCLCKTARAGYDGKGQWRLSGTHDVMVLQERLRVQDLGRESGLAVGRTRWILEQFLSFDKELSVLVTRAQHGERRTYPAVENLHEAGILRVTRVPAQIEPRTADRARALAEAVVEALEGVGVFCVELFLMRDGRLFINEVAPRPHNSGHYTLDACTVSQFEQQVRAVCGLPLGEVRLLCPAVMVNLIGEDLNRVTVGEGLRELLRAPGAKLHVYGKRPIRPGRKMGHVTFLGEKPDDAWSVAQSFCRLLENFSGPVTNLDSTERP